MDNPNKDATPPSSTPKPTAKTTLPIEPTHAAKALKVQLAAMTAHLKSLPPEEATDADEENRRQIVDSAQRARMTTLLKTRGSRYARCWFSTYQTYCKPQEAVKTQLEAYARDVINRVRLGQNLFLYGPSETGKDHLLMALSRQAILAGINVRWENGLRFYSRLRRAMAENTPDEDVIDNLASPEVLWLSDPLPPRNKPLESYRAECLFLLLDERRNRDKPTWVSMNVQDLGNAAERIGGSTLNRLTLDGLTLNCNWPRYANRNSK